MQTSELKDLLIQRIQDIDDEVFLEALRTIIERPAPPYELSVFERQKIARARVQVDSGESFTNEEVFDKVNQWLKK